MSCGDLSNNLKASYREQNNNRVRERRTTMPKLITPEEKQSILARVAEIGAAAAAKEAGVSYNSVLRWVHADKNPIKAVKKGAPGDLVERLNAQIEAREEGIKELEEALKERKAELKELQKAKMRAEKEKELLDAAEEKKKLVEAVMNSGKSVDEIMAFLNK